MYNFMKSILVQVNQIESDLSLDEVVEELEHNPKYPSHELVDWLQREGLDIIRSLGKIDQKRLSSFIDEQKIIMSIVIEEVMQTKDWKHFNEVFMHTVFYVKEFIVQQTNKK